MTVAELIETPLTEPKTERPMMKTEISPDKLREVLEDPEAHSSAELDAAAGLMRKSTASVLSVINAFADQFAGEDISPVKNGAVALILKADELDQIVRWRGIQGAIGVLR